MSLSPKLFDWKQEKRSSKDEIEFVDCEFLSNYGKVRKGEKADTICLNLTSFSLTCNMNSGYKVTFNISDDANNLYANYVASGTLLRNL
jgi:hypothetical protein